MREKLSIVEEPKSKGYGGLPLGPNLFNGHQLEKSQRIGSQIADNTGFSFFEFFAGGGMARAGLGANWRCLFANDFDYKKSAVYIHNWGDGQLMTKDVGKLQTKDLPGTPDLVWASFPCQDLSLAGMGAGLKGDRSGTFWPFWRLMKKLRSEARAPRVIVLENVCGTLTSHNGKDFAAISEALSETNYRFGAIILDAAEFVPQSRPRLFIIAVREDIAIPPPLIAGSPMALRHTHALRLAHSRLSESSQSKWLWWNVKKAPKRKSRFVDLIENNPTSVRWHTEEETRQLLAMMSNVNRKKLAEAQSLGKLQVGAIYKRTRLDENGEKVQRAEVRFDNLAGCLRTPSGGSSRQLVIVVKGKQIRSRLISSRETARLMGLPDSYVLPSNYNEAYHLTGDGVAVPVVRHIASCILEPLLSSQSR